VSLQVAGALSKCSVSVDVSEGSKDVNVLLLLLEVQFVQLVRIEQVLEAARLTSNAQSLNRLFTLLHKRWMFMWG